MTNVEDTTAAVVEPQEPAPKAAPKKSQAAAKKSQAVAVAAPPAPPAPPPSGSLAVLQQAMANGATGDDLKNLLDVYERLEAREARKAFDVAMALAQAEMPVIVKNRLVDYENKKKDDNGQTTRTTYRHEDLAQVVDTIKPVLHKHGLAHRFRTDHLDGGQIKVTCIITGHGWREETSLQSSRDTSGGKNDVQGIGSIVTYLERYTLKAALGLAAAHDDDGRSSEGSPTTITALQLQELEALVKEVNANVDKACQSLGIKSLAELPIAKFEKAKAKLETMRVPL
jgi:hypothetical protein